MIKYKRLSDYLDIIKKALDATLEKKDWATARQYGEMALKKLFHLSHSPSEKYLLYNTLGRIYALSAEHSRAFDVFHRAYLTATKHHFQPAETAYSSFLMMYSLFNLYWYKQAFAQFQKLEQYFQKYGTKTPPMDEQTYIRTYLFMGYYYLYHKELKKVREILEAKLLPYQSLLSKGFFLIDYQHLKGEYLTSLKNYAAASESFRICISESKKMNFSKSALEAEIHLAIIELFQNRPDNAIEIFENISEEAHRQKLNDLICETGIFLSKCYQMKGMAQKKRNMETRLRPFLDKLDTVWLYETSRTVEELFLQIGRRSQEPLPAEIISYSEPDILTITINQRHQTGPFKTIIGKSSEMQKVYQLLKKIAPTDLPVLIQGETGTGKELVANAIHQNSLRKDKTFSAFNCNTIPETLIESHLFGHTKDAFTGAVENKKGYIELATGGTIFVDEIGSMSLQMQTKFLRVLEEQEIRPVGSEKSIPVNTRFIFASNQKIEELIKNKLFREDLFYRINTIVIDLPPLRRREGDVPLLINYFFNKYSKDTRPIIIHPEALDILLKYPWFGNIRELENEVKRICVLYPGIKLLHKEMFSESIINSRALALPSANEGATFKELADTYQRNLIIEALSKCEGNVIDTARLLGYARTNLYRKIKQLKITLRGTVIKWD